MQKLAFLSLVTWGNMRWNGSILHPNKAILDWSFFFKSVRWKVPKSWWFSPHYECDLANFLRMAMATSFWIIETCVSTKQRRRGQKSRKMNDPKGAHLTTAQMINRLDNPCCWHVCSESRKCPPSGEHEANRSVQKRAKWQQKNATDWIRNGMTKLHYKIVKWKWHEFARWHRHGANVVQKIWSSPWLAFSEWPQRTKSRNRRIPTNIATFDLNFYG